jgi:hypothetical protein
VEPISEASVAATFGNTQVRAWGCSGLPQQRQLRACCLCVYVAVLLAAATCAHTCPPAAAHPGTQEFSQHMDHGYILFYERVSP